MQRVRTFLVCAALAAVPFAAGPVAAQPAKVDPQKAKTAKEYVNAGLAAQNAKDYDTAISLYQKAYDLVPHPVLLFNIGQAHRLAGRDAEAKSFYERYVAADPKGAQAKVARDLIAEITSKLEAVTKAEDAKRAEEAARKAEEAKQAEDARREQALVQAERDQQAAIAAERAHQRAESERIAKAKEDERASAGRPLRIAGIAGVVLGGASVGVAIAMGLEAGRISDELSEQGAVFDPAKVDEGESAERLSIITGVAGGALIIGGAVVYFLGRKQRAEHSSGVSLVLESDQVGIAFRGAWR